MKTELKQVVVVGAGPSGSTVSALLKSRGIDVVVLEKATFPRFSIGESLLPA
ncbi:tryptophan 7-halogenase, partial [Vibrio alginolyticus]